MKTFVFFLFVVFIFSGCGQKNTQNQPDETNLKYPVYENCDSVHSNEESLACMGEKLNLFYHYMLTHDYAGNITNKEDSLILWLEIDTTGQLKAQKIEHLSGKTDKEIDSVIYLITEKSPAFIPAKYEDKKVPFRLKLPVILTKNH